LINALERLFCAQPGAATRRARRMNMKTFRTHIGGEILSVNFGGVEG
jgi:hypothetical protein